MSTGKTIIMAGGGTGGHIYPAVSIARALIKKDPSIKIEFVGAKGGLEERLVPKEGFPLSVLPIGPLNKSAGLLKRLQTLIVLPLSLIQATLLVFRLKPILVIGVGGYASAPLVLMSALLGTRSVLFEPNAYPGLANRWLSSFVDLCLVVFDGAAKKLSARRFEKVGLPVRPELFAKGPRDHVTPNKISFINEEQQPISQSALAAGFSDVAKEAESRTFRLLVFGGSQGARRINDIILAAVQSGDAWLRNTHVVHQIGALDFQKVHGEYEAARQKFPWLKVDDFEFLFDMPERYRWADLVICRAGASTVAELIVMQKPALFVPLPTAADDHQTHNARVLVEAGAALMCPQKEFSPHVLARYLEEFRRNPQKLTELSHQLKRLQVFDAAGKIADLCLDLAKS